MHLTKPLFFATDESNGYNIVGKTRGQFIERDSEINWLL